MKYYKILLYISSFPLSYPQVDRNQVITSPQIVGLTAPHPTLGYQVNIIYPMFIFILKYRNIFISNFISFRVHQVGDVGHK